MLGTSAQRRVSPIPASPPVLSDRYRSLSFQTQEAISASPQTRIYALTHKHRAQEPEFPSDAAAGAALPGRQDKG